MVEIEEHPLLAAEFVAHELPAALGDLAPGPPFDPPFERSEETRQAIRRLLRHGGYRPTGRGKPASEYLVRAAEESGLPVVNPVVDALNAISLASGHPMSVIDLDRIRTPLTVRVAREGSSYVFNRSGQEIGLKGLLCLRDAEGPCANAVKDSQRTKTHDETTRTLSIVWGSRDLPAEHFQRTLAWYRALHEQVGARVS